MQHIGTAREDCTCTICTLSMDFENLVGHMQQPEQRCEAALCFCNECCHTWCSHVCLSMRSMSSSEGMPNPLCT